jgi:hypothetical protein
MGESTRRVAMRELAELLGRCRDDQSRRALFNTAELLGLNPMEILELEADRRISRHVVSHSEVSEEPPVCGGDGLPENVSVT